MEVQRKLRLPPVLADRLQRGLRGRPALLQGQAGQLGPSAISWRISGLQSVLAQHDAAVVSSPPGTPCPRSPLCLMSVLPGAHTGCDSRGEQVSR